MNGDQQTDPTPKGAKRAVNKLLVDVEEDLHDYKGGCLFVTNDDGTYCDEPVTNNCHIVSESAVLDGMKDDKTKKVLELQWGVGQWRKLMFNSDRVQLVQDPTTFGPAPATTRNACVGRFACKQRAHDDEFQPIDVAEPDFCDPVVRFLAAYRSMLFFMDQCRQSLELHREWNRDAMKGPNAKARVLWLRQKANLEKALREADANVRLLGKNWHARKTTQTFDPDLVSAEVLGFRSKLRIAGCVYYGKHVAVTVFPTQGDWHKMGGLYFTSECGPASEELGRLAEVARASKESDDYGIVVTNEVMTNGWGLLAVSQKSYERLDDQDRETVNGLVAKHARDMQLVQSIVGQTRARKRRRR